MPVAACPTEELAELIAGLSLCEAVICSDGGAMHLAAGLGKPILCLFGQSDATRWHPWGVPYELLQAESRDVADHLRGRSGGGLRTSPGFSGEARPNDGQSAFNNTFERRW